MESFSSIFHRSLQIQRTQPEKFALTWSSAEDNYYEIIFREYLQGD